MSLPDPRDIVFEYKLTVRPGPRGGVVWVPGCEPASELTSTTLTREMKKSGMCPSPYVHVKDVLEGIPGTRLDRIDNAGIGTGRNILVFPASSLSCPCPSVEDWYDLLKDFMPSVVDDDLVKLHCSAFGHDCADFRGYNGVREYR